MQSEKPKRGHRIVEQFKQLGIPINNFKDFLNSKLQLTFPQGYSTMSTDQKKDAWRHLINKLKIQPKKLSYQLPDSRPLEEIDLIIEVVNQQNGDDSLDYQFEEMFLGNKKQLVVFKKCKEMIDYLQKYRLPKPFEGSLKDVQTVAKSLFELKIQRNIAISLKHPDKINEINEQIKGLEDKFQKAFEKFCELMKKILDHFKGQKKRVSINIQPLREIIFQKLKPLVYENDLNICPRYQDVDNDQFIAVQITKKTQFDRYFDAQFFQNEKIKPQNDEDQYFTDGSSVVSDMSEEQKQLIIEEKIKKALPPSGVYSIKFKNYQDKILKLQISFETSRNPWQTPTQLQYTEDPVDFKNSIKIENVSKDILLDIPIQKGGFLSYHFRTKNLAGFSRIKNFKYLLKVDSQLNSITNGRMYFIGQDKYLIPAERTKIQGDFAYLTLVVNDFSMSSTQVSICDADGNSADWGLFKQQNKQNEKVVEENNLFKVVNTASNMFYHEPMVRLENKFYTIVKTSCGAGYCMFLDAFGEIWVFGKNHCGQLGIKDEVSVEEPIKLKFFEEKKIFITDIKSSQSLASFAIDSNGTLYKWGVNQFHSTNHPIYDRFGKLMNYALATYLEQQWVPIPVKKHFGTEKIIQIEAGNEFYLMLNNEGTLFGWGQCRNLGKGTLKDGKDEEIQNICNQIELMANVLKLGAGRNHAIVLTKERKIIGWGNLDYLSNLKKDFSESVIDLTEQYGEVSDEDILSCGPNYTCHYISKENKIKLYGDSSKFEKKQFEMKQKIRKIECGHEVIILLSDK